MNALLSNPFKRGLLRGETQIGLWLSSTSSYMAEIAATSGYDWLLIDGEHAPNTIQDLYHQLQAIAPYASRQNLAGADGRYRRAGSGGGLSDPLSPHREPRRWRRRGESGALGKGGELYGGGE